MSGAKISLGASEFNPYENNNYLKGPKEFLNHQSIIAKFTFLLLVVFVFFILLRIGAELLEYLSSFSKSPTLLKGTMRADQLVVVAQDPNTAGSIPILRSRNQRDGLEFTWSVWIWVDQPTLSNNQTSTTNQYHHVFSKGSDQVGSDGILTPNNGPGLYIGPNYRELVVVMSTFENPQEKIIIGDIPIRKWVNVIIRCDQRTFDVFINGVLTRSHILKGIPKQNYDNVYIGLNGGFNGHVSSLKYFAYLLGTNDIQSMIDSGPDLTKLDKDLTDTKPRYLSFRWFFPKRIAEVEF